VKLKLDSEFMQLGFDRYPWVVVFSLSHLDHRVESCVLGLSVYSMRLRQTTNVTTQHENDLALIVSPFFACQDTFLEDRLWRRPCSGGGTGKRDLQRHMYVRASQRVPPRKQPIGNLDHEAPRHPQLRRRLNVVRVPQAPSPADVNSRVSTRPHYSQEMVFPETSYCSLKIRISQ
jgi:hypothetical protein